MMSNILLCYNYTWKFVLEVFRVSVCYFGEPQENAKWFEESANNVSKKQIQILGVSFCIHV